MVMPDETKIAPDFCVSIDFERNSAHPERVFTAMTELIYAFQEFDNHLARTLDIKIQPVIMLEDIKTGSLKTWLSSFLKAVPDEAIGNLDWKQAVGKYLVKGKYILINWLDGKTMITDSQEIIDIQHEILEAAKETGVNNLNTYSPIHPKNLISSIGKINSAVANLNQNGDSAQFISDEGDASFNLTLKVSPENLEDLITKEKIESTSLMILKVKKPDYLGDSMWEFIYGHVIKVKVTHYQWLKDFQDRKIDVRPGDSIRALVKTTVKYGFDYSVIDTHYELVEVIEVIGNTPPGQQLSLGD